MSSSIVIIEMEPEWVVSFFKFCLGRSSKRKRCFISWLPQTHNGRSTHPRKSPASVCVSVSPCIHILTLPQYHWEMTLLYDFHGALIASFAILIFDGYCVTKGWRQGRFACEIFYISMLGVICLPRPQFNIGAGLLQTRNNLQKSSLRWGLRSIFYIL